MGSANKGIIKRIVSILSINRKQFSRQSQIVIFECDTLSLDRLVSGASDFWWNLIKQIHIMDPCRAKVDKEIPDMIFLVS